MVLLYIITYDIPDDKRRKKIADLLEGYGARVQYSVFECILSQKKYSELKKRLKRIFKDGNEVRNVGLTQETRFHNKKPGFCYYSKY